MTNASAGTSGSLSKPSPAAGAGAGAGAGRSGTSSAAGSGTAAPVGAAAAGNSASTGSAGISAANGGTMAAADSDAGTMSGGTTTPVTTNPESGGQFAQCVAGLKKMCRYDDKMTACSSLVTAQIPLTDGGTWGNNEILSGPYGAFVEWNQGKDFANPISDSESSCDLIASTFGEPASVTAETLDLMGGDLSLYTIFRPACLKDGETYPVITWGNGTCGQSGGYASLLATVASYGFVVIAANSRFTDGGNKEMLKALDLAKALNEKEGGVLYQHLNLEKIGAMGHSQGSSATANAAPDPRIKAVILWNAGLSIPNKPFLAVSGDRDISGYTPTQMNDAVQSASQPGAYLYYHQVLETGGSVTGHLTLMEQPERVWEPTVAWWKYILNGDAEAKKMFAGSDCGLCNKQAEFEFGANPNVK